MEPKQVVCPICGGSLGEIDALIGLAVVSHIDEAGQIAWAGDTDINWDAQKSAYDPPRFACLECDAVFERNGNQFTALQEQQS